MADIKNKHWTATAFEIFMRDFFVPGAPENGYAWSVYRDQFRDAWNGFSGIIKEPQMMRDTEEQ